MQAYADQTRRGYTEHEMLDNVGLIHMNGRVYDPGVGRFMSADPIADGLGEAGGFNRYAYVQNSPLSWVDPEGWESQCLVANCKPRSDPPAGTRINLPGYTSASNTSCIGNCGGASGYLRRTYVTEQSQVGDHVTVTGRTQLTWVSYNYSPMIADFLKGYSGSTSVFDERTAAVEAGEFARGVIDAGAAVIGAGLIIADLANTAWPGLQGPDVGVVGLGMIMARSGAARTVGHHTIPKAIQKQLPPSVRNHPDVVGRAGNPNVRQIPEASHRRIHSSPPGNYYPGGDYNHRFDQLIRERGGYDAVSPRDVNQNRDQLVREFGL
jgi:RHS repeat-associated protein